MHRVVIDTNVLISGIIQKRGFPFKIVSAWEDGSIILVTSAAMIEEARKVLEYPKIKEKYTLEEGEIRQTVLNLMRYSVFVDDIPRLDVIKEDPSDNVILATAVKGSADYIVSGDAHLLKVNSFRGIRVVTPKDFCRAAGL